MHPQAGDHQTPTSYPSNRLLKTVAVQIQVILRPTVSRPVRLGVGAHDHIFINYLLALAIFI
jgi:hypothetical protein